MSFHAGPALPALADEGFVRMAYEALSGADAYPWYWLGSLDRFRGLLALRLGLLDEAERHFGTGSEWCEREGCPVELGLQLQGLAEVAERRGDVGQAIEHLDRAGELFERHGARLYLDQVHAKLATLPVTGSPRSRFSCGLTRREVEVLQHIAAGKTNPQIADSLFVSSRTVERHIQNIYNKVGVHNRVEAANWARENGIVP